MSGARLSDGTGTANVATGVPVLDHLLETFPRLRGPFRQLLRRNPLHQRAATLLRDRGLGRARSLARRAETAETHI